MAESDKTAEKGPGETPAIEVSPEPIDGPAPKPRPRRPAATLGVAAVLVAIGIGLYVAWPRIMPPKAPPAPSPPAPIAEAPPSPPVEQSPPPPVEPAPAAEAPGPSAPSAEAPGTITPEPAPPPIPSEAERAALAEIESLKTRLAAMEEAEAARAAAPAPMPAIDDAALAGLVTRLEVLEQRPAEMGAMATAAPDPELAARVAQLEARLAAAETSAADAAQLREHLAEVQASARQMSERLAGLEARAAEDVRLIGLIAAKSALVLAGREGQPLAHELADFRAILPESPALAPALAALEPFAEHAAPTFEALRLRFPEIARLAVRAAGEPDPEAGWLDQTASRLGTIITIRKTGGELEPGSLDERLLRAERALNENDAAAAREALDGVKGGEAVEAFRTDLARRLALDEALKAIDRHVAALVVGRASPALGDATTTQ